jgi:GNAT superfamily N-acetyltransferase
MVYEISDATANDINDLSEILMSGWQESYRGIIRDSWVDGLSVDEFIEKWRSWLSEEGLKVKIARDDEGEASGFVSYGKLKTPPPGSSPIRPLYSSEIYGLYVVPACMRQGLGRRLFNCAVKDLIETGHKSLCLWTFEKNKRASEFYKSLGGQRCGKRDVSVGPDQAREICYGWREI